MGRGVLGGFWGDVGKMKGFREVKVGERVVIVYFIVRILGFVGLEKGHMVYWV